MGEVNWKTKEFIEAKVGDVIAPFLTDEDYKPIIAEAELAIECLGFLAWTPVDQGSIVTFSGGGNANAFSWIRKGEAKAGLGRDILAGFQLYVAIRSLRHQPFFMRTHTAIPRPISSQEPTPPRLKTGASEKVLPVSQSIGGGKKSRNCRNSPNGKGGFRKKDR